MCLLPVYFYNSDNKPTFSATAFDLMSKSQDLWWSLLPVILSYVVKCMLPGAMFGDFSLQ